MQGTGARRAGASLGAAILVALLLSHGGCGTAKMGPTPCTATPPAQDSYCTALADYDGRCGHCGDCTGRNLQNCTEAGAAISDPYRAAFVSCRNALPCGSDPRFSSCVLQEMVSVVPTAAQMQAKTAYCNACGATSAQCTGFFAIDPNAGTYGTGYNVLVVDDAIAMSTVTTCSSQCDALHYGICVALLSCGPSGGDFCADGGLCAAH
jgi:hypothetical protein